MNNYPSAVTRKTSQSNPPPSHPPPPLPTSDTMQLFDLQDQSFMKETNYSIFANNHQAMSSNLSLHNSQDPIYMHSSFNNNYPVADTNVDFLPNMYGINEFEFNNVSYESLPAISDKTSQSQFDLVDNSDWYPCPYTPTLHDNHLSNFSEASFTSHTDYQDLSASAGSVSAHTPINPNSITKRSLSMQLQQTQAQHLHLQHFQQQQQHLSQSPLSKHLQLGVMPSHFSGRTTPISINNLNESPPSLTHTQSNLSNLGLTTIGSNNSYQQQQQPPPSAYFQSPTSTSPIVTHYKALDINSPILPPQNSFRHNSDSSFNSTTSSIETPRRYPSSTNGFSHKISLHSNNSNLDLTPPIFNPTKCLSKKNSVTSLNDISKPKKHTRKRILPRSKDGCWICRIKHLKCDECKPVCNSCQRFGIECDYSPDKPLYVSDKNLRKEKLASIAQVRKTSTISIQKKKSKVKLLG